MKKFLFILGIILGLALGYFVGTSLSGNRTGSGDTTLQETITQQEAKIKELQDSVDNYQTQLSHYTQPQTLTNETVESFISSIIPDLSKEQVASAIADGTAHITLGANNTATFTRDGDSTPITLKMVENNIISVAKDAAGNITNTYIYNTVTNNLTNVENTIFNTPVTTP